MWGREGPSARSRGIEIPKTSSAVDVDCRAVTEFISSRDQRNIGGSIRVASTLKCCDECFLVVLGVETNEERSRIQNCHCSLTLWIISVAEEGFNALMMKRPSSKKT